MKHTTEELLFAAAVLRRVTELRSAKYLGMTEAEKDAFDAQPINALVEQAMKELNGIATVIAQVRSR